MKKSVSIYLTDVDSSVDLGALLKHLESLSIPFSFSTEVEEDVEPSKAEGEDLPQIVKEAMKTYSNPYLTKQAEPTTVPLTVASNNGGPDTIVGSAEVYPDGTAMVSFNNDSAFAEMYMAGSLHALSIVGINPATDDKLRSVRVEETNCTGCSDCTAEMKKE